MEKKYDHQVTETQVRLLWQQEKTYATPGLRSLGGVGYSIDTPPPTVSGSLHIGHIFSYTQTDIIARYKRLQGFAIFYPFGFDDNGLPTERYVEKKKGVTAGQLGRSAFIKLCLSETQDVEAQFKELWQRMGLSVDWSQCYATIDERTRRISQASFIKLYEKGFIYRKEEPALFCTTCRTAVAQAELDDIEQPSVFYDITFQAADGAPLQVATTRPELLSSCVALLYHPDDKRYTHLAGSKARVPLFDNEVPLIADTSVLPEKGTGLVMCCTFGDKTDVAWFKKYNLPYRPSFGADGRWLPTTGVMAGLKAKPAREAVVAALRQAGSLVGERSITHAVNVHERCKQPIEFLVLPQWFLKILPYKKELTALADKINWYPAFMKSRYINWVEHIGWDWCLSRQRFYGIPFPAWHCPSCGYIKFADIDKLPVDPQEVAGGNCPQCAHALVPDTDVMDTWNTSSLTPYICQALATGDDTTLFEKPYTPMAMRPQAHDIIRTWTFYTITKTWMHHGEIPWHDIVISGHVLSSAQEKISKSKGNSVLEPHELLKQYPADAIRYWTASGTLGQDVAFSEAQIKMGSRLLVKLWNAFLFIKEHGKLSDDALVEDPVNRWITSQAAACFSEYQKAFDGYEFGLALNGLETFFWRDFCDNYLELIKDQLFNPGNYDADMVAATKHTLHTIGMRLLQLYAPFIPHMTESIYQELYRTTDGAVSLHQTAFARYQQPAQHTESQKFVELLLQLVGEVRRLKTEHKLSLRTELAELTLIGNAATLATLRSQEAVVKGIARAATVVYQEGSGTSALIAQGEQWRGTVALP